METSKSGEEKKISIVHLPAKQQLFGDEQIDDVLDSCEGIILECRRILDATIAQKKRQKQNRLRRSTKSNRENQTRKIKEDASNASRTVALILRIMLKLHKHFGGETDEDDLLEHIAELRINVANFFLNCIEEIDHTKKVERDLSEDYAKVLASVKIVIWDVSKFSQRKLLIHAYTQEELRTRSNDGENEEDTVTKMGKKLMARITNLSTDNTEEMKSTLTDVDRFIRILQRKGMVEDQTELITRAHELREIVAQAKIAANNQDEGASKILARRKTAIDFDAVKLVLSQRVHGTIRKDRSANPTHQYAFLRAKRRQTVKELANTEKAYFLNLKTFEHLFVKPLEKTEPNLVDDADVSAALASWRAIIVVTKAIMQDLKSIVLSWNEEEEAEGKAQEISIGKILLQFIPLLKFYRGYIASMEIAQEKITKASKINPAIASLIDLFEQENDNFWDLGMYFILPIQRLPRYELLLAEIFKSTPKSHPDFMDTKLALAEFRTLNQWINESKLHADNQRKIMDLILSINESGVPLPPQANFLKSGYYYIREGVLFAPSKKLKKSFHYFMLNKCMIKTKPVQMKSSGSCDTVRYRFVDLIYYNKVDLVKGCDNLSWTFVERQKRKGRKQRKQTFVTLTEDDCTAWLKDLQREMKMAVLLEIG
eukprot:TRINITY_DN5930_c0_g1_i4.p1 TRINITY_DN5930_c0_g1~~TRINITY_DN5930_c0_g1_i4.p1  ORF type:complete len:713 (+),score=136.97 TRINITY_DN5930_c0_g1_i4:173-2140(+)